MSDEILHVDFGMFLQFLCQGQDSVYLTCVMSPQSSHFCPVTCKVGSLLFLFRLSHTKTCQLHTKEGSRILSCWVLPVRCVYLLCQKLRDYTVYKQWDWNLVRCLLGAKVTGREVEMHC